MSALFFIVGFGYLIWYHIARDNISPTVGGALYVVMMLSVGIGWAWQIISDYRERKRWNEDKFLHEVVAAHLMVQEARRIARQAAVRQ